MADDAAIDADCLRRVRLVCDGFDGADEGLLQGRPLFRVGRRRFAIFNGATSPPRPRWNSSGRSLHLLADPLERDALEQDDRFGRSPHHGDRGWFMLSLADPQSVDWAEVSELLDSAFGLVTRRSGHEGHP